MANVFLMGMYRTGTSILTQLLSKLGFELPEEQQVLAKESRPYEKMCQVLPINNEILKMLGASWREVPPLPEAWADDAKLALLIPRMKGLYPKEKHWLLTDPQNSLTMPLWKKAFPDMRIIICIRNPIEVAQSLTTALATSQNFTVDEAFKLWQTYYETILKTVEDKNVLWVNYESLFHYPKEELKRILDYLVVDLDDKTIEKAITLIDTESRRQLIPHALIDKNYPSSQISQYYAYSCSLCGENFEAFLNDSPKQYKIAWTYLQTTASLQLQNLQLSQKQVLDLNQKLAESNAKLEDSENNLQKQIEEKTRAQAQEIMRLNELLSQQKQNVEINVEENQKLKSTLQNLQKQIEAQEGESKLYHDLLEESYAQTTAINKSLRRKILKHKGKKQQQDLQILKLEKRILSHKLKLQQLQDKITNQEENFSALNQSLEKEKNIAQANLNHYKTLADELKFQLEREEALHKQAQLTRPIQTETNKSQNKLNLRKAFNQLILSHQLGIRIFRWLQTWRYYSLLENSSLFDTKWYLAQYPDVAAAAIDPIKHYLQYGADEGRNPSPFFETRWYIKQYQDILSASMNPLVHYLLFGIYENRQTMPIKTQTNNKTLANLATHSPHSLSPLQASSKNKKIILFHSHNLQWQGASNSLYELATAIHKTKDYQAMVFSPSFGPLMANYLNSKIPMKQFTIPTQTNNPKNFEKALNELAYLYKSSGANLVHANTLETFYAVLAANRANIPVIWNIRESEPLNNFYEYLDESLKSYVQQSIAGADRLIFVSNKTRENWQKYEAEKYMDTIHNGIDIERLHLRVYNRNRHEIRAALNLKQDDIFILSVGTVSSRKSQMDLAKALKHLDPILHGKIFVRMIGFKQTAYSQLVFQTFQNLERDGIIRFMFDSESTSEEESRIVAESYFAADIFVLCSQFESYPRVIVEALAFGLPVIASASFGVLEQIEDGKSGLLYPYGDCLHLGQLISKLALNHDYRLEMSNAARKRAQHINSYQKMVLAYQSHYHAMIFEK